MFIPEAWNLSEHPSATCGTFPIDQGGPKAPQIMQIVNIPLSFTPQFDCMTYCQDTTRFAYKT